MPKNNSIIPMPTSILFTTQIPVQISHINYGNHLGYDAMVSLLHEAQVRFFNHHGHTELDIDGLSVVVQKLEIVYKKEAFYGELLQFSIGLGELTKARAELLFSVSNATGNEICRAKTTLVFVDPAVRKVVAVPSFLKQS